jgi:hypothetical protein
MVYESRDVFKLRGCPFCMSYRINTQDNIAKVMTPEIIEKILNKKEKSFEDDDAEVIAPKPKKRGRPHSVNK